MADRVTSRCVVFKHPFSLDAFGGVLPSGSYVIETGEELIEGVSFPAWRSRWMTIRVPPTSGGSRFDQIVTIDAEVLAAAIALDNGAGHQDMPEATLLAAAS